MTSSPDTSDTDTGVELTENNDGCVQAIREHPIAEDTDQISSYWTNSAVLPSDWRIWRPP